LPCEERLWDWGWFSWKKGFLQGHQTASTAPLEGDGGDAVRLFTVVQGGKFKGSGTS